MPRGHTPIMGIFRICAFIGRMSRFGKKFMIWSLDFTGLIPAIVTFNAPDSRTDLILCPCLPQKMLSSHSQEKQREGKNGKKNSDMFL